MALLRKDAQWLAETLQERTKLPDLAQGLDAWSPFITAYPQRWKAKVKLALAVHVSGEAEVIKMKIW